MNNRKGAMGKGMELLVLALIVFGAVAMLGGNVPILSDWLGSVGGDKKDGGGTINKIEVDVKQTDKACGSTTMTMDFAVKYAEGRAITAQNGTIFITGKDGKKARRGVVSEGSTFTAQGGDKLDIYYALDPAQTTYLASHASGAIPCTGQTAAFLTSAILSKGSGSEEITDPHLVYEADSSGTTTIINDDFTSNPGTRQAIGVGATRHVNVKLYPVFEEGYGVADGSTLACRFTDSQIDQEKTAISLSGKKLLDAKYTPTSTLFAVSATNQSTKFWQVSPVDAGKSTLMDFDFGIKGDDTNEPTAATNFSCAIFGTDYYEKDTGEILIDVEDRDDNTKIGRTAGTEFSFDIALS